MSDTSLALGNLGFIIAADIVRSMREQNRVATGQTIRDIEVVVESETRMYITGPAYIGALEKGRKATSPTGPFQRYGGLTFKDSLRLWMEARGIDQGKKSKNAVYGPVLWAIYTKINKEGYTGRPGVLSTPLSNENLNKAMDKELGSLANIFASRVMNDLFK